MSHLFCPNQLYAAITRATDERFTQITDLSEYQIDVLQRERTAEIVADSAKANLHATKRKFMHLFDAQTAYTMFWHPSPSGKAYQRIFPQKVKAYTASLKEKTQQYDNPKKARM